MADLGGNPWWVVVAGGLPSAASAVWVAWQWRVNRKDKREETDLSRQDRLMREVDDARARLSKDQADTFDRLRGELLRCQARLEEVERDRDRGWDLARYWNRRAHELRHAALNAQTIAQNVAQQAGLPVPTWPDMNLPGFEEPK